MARSPGSRGTSPAPIPTPISPHPHQMSKGPSREDVEMAEHLSQLNQAHVPHSPRMAPSQDVQPAPTPPGQTSEIYHSLEDTLRVRESQQPEQTLSPSPPLSGAPINGQSCSNCGTTKTPLWRRSTTGGTLCNACGLYQKARNQQRPTNLKRNTPAQPIVPGQGHDRSTSPGEAAPSPRVATYVAADHGSNGTCPGGGRCNGMGGQQGCSGCPAFNNRVSKTAQYVLAQTNASTNSSGTPSNDGASQSTVTSVMQACQNCQTTVTPLWRRDEAGQTICNACGLYHRLHGTHRPVAMGKQEIKRRKRIVPADVQTPSIASYSPQQPGTEIRAIEHSVSPAPTTTIDSSEIYPLHARIPVPVDFTTYQNNSHPTANQRGPSTKNLGAPSPRKRSLSATLDPNEVASGPARSVPHRPNAISSLLNPTASQDDRIDPALSALSRPTSGPSPNIQDQKVIRKEKLRREAEAMRQELERREKELQELEELEELED